MTLLLLLGCNDYKLSSQLQDPPAAHDTESWTDSEPLLDSAPPQDSDPPPSEDEIPEDAAPEPIYVNSGSTLYSYDPEDNQLSQIGSFKLDGTYESGVTDIAIDLQGQMTAVTAEALFSVDPLSAELTLIANLEPYLNALTYLSDGRLMGAGEDRIYEIDPATGRADVLVSIPYESAGDIVGLPDGMLYLSVWDDYGLVRLDPEDWSVQWLGATGEYGLWGLGYAYDELWAFSSNGDALLLNQRTAEVEGRRGLGGTWWGATTNPVFW